MTTSISMLALLAVVAFIQNMFFTWTSRSRNSGDPQKHLYASIGSNGIWFICNYFLLFPEVMKITETGTLLDKGIVMIVYILATALGSVAMMKVNLGHWYIPFLTEEGKSQVGARKS